MGEGMGARSNVATGLHGDRRSLELVGRSRCEV